MKRKRLILSCLLVLMWPVISSAQEMEAQLELSTGEIKIGEQIHALLQVQFNVNEKVSFPILKDTLTGHLEIVSASKIDTSYDQNDLSIKILSQEMLITSWDTGYHTLPPITFYSEHDSVFTEPYLIHVLDVPVELPKSENEELGIKDIKDIQEVRFSIWEWFKANLWIFVIILLAAAMVFVYIKYIHPRLKKKNILEVIQAPKIPPHEMALSQLEQLKEKKLWQQGRVKEFHSELSEIIRNYIELRFMIPALESTTFEIIAALKQQNLNESSIDVLRKAFELADLVKFAKHNPLPDENTTSFEAGVQFIHETKPKPIEQPESV